MKKCFSLLTLLIFMAVLFSSCFDNKAGYYPQTPEYMDILQENLHVDDDIEAEPDTDYSNITVYSDDTVYNKKSKKIEYYIKNNNPHKGIWVRDVVQAESLVNGEWVQLLFEKDDNVAKPEVWISEYKCAENEEGYVVVKRVFYFSKLEKSLKAGEYRLVVFVGNETLYLPFTVE